MITRNPKRSYIPKKVTKAHHRLANSGFYHTKEWRRFRNAYWEQQTELSVKEAIQMKEDNASIEYTVLRGYLDSNAPLCVHCKNKGVIKAAYVADHIKPINPREPYNTQGGRYGEPLEIRNLQPLCERCHNSKSGKEAHL